jgi:hypothetical protein
MSSETKHPAITPEQAVLFRKMGAIFMPHLQKQRDAVYQMDGTSGVHAKSARFVHYTTAKAALGIINTKRLWMRNTQCMSDYREVQHGYDLLQNYFSEEVNKSAFTDAVDACSPGAASKAVSQFDQWWRDVRFNTYVTSISEHDTREDLHGRLSMWRAFGGETARVALVLNIPWGIDAVRALGLFFNPVAYLNEKEACDVLHEATANIKGHKEFLQTVDSQLLVGFVLTMFITAVTSLKHEGFREEREWRATYLPHILPSSLMESSTEVICGVPQLIYKVPLDESVSTALSSLEFSSIFDRLIVGPSRYPGPMYEAFKGALVKAGVPQATAEKQVYISGIPLRV